MLREILAVALVFGLIGSAEAVMIFRSQEEGGTSAVSLPAYDNPMESDVDEGRLHVSFKGIFRITDGYVYACFVATPDEDMEMNIDWDGSRIFDSQGTIFELRDPSYWIGKSPVRSREIVRGIPMPVLVGTSLTTEEAGQFPIIARIRFKCMGTQLEFRNIKVRDWPEWEKIRDSLGLAVAPIERQEP